MTSTAVSGIRHVIVQCTWIRHIITIKIQEHVQLYWLNVFSVYSRQVLTSWENVMCVICIIAGLIQDINSSQKLPISPLGNECNYISKPLKCLQSPRWWGPAHIYEKRCSSRKTFKGTDSHLRHRKPFLQKSSITYDDALRDLVPFVRFQKHEKYPWRSVTFSEVAGWSWNWSLQLC